MLFVVFLELKVGPLRGVRFLIVVVFKGVFNWSVGVLRSVVFEQNFANRQERTVL